jgi:hypothetical protein
MNGSCSVNDFTTPDFFNTLPVDMKKIIGYIQLYARDVDKPILAFCTLFTALLIWLNYHEGLERFLVIKLDWPFPVFTGHFILFLFAFIVPHFLLYLRNNDITEMPAGYIIALIAAPAIFALKMGMKSDWNFSIDPGWNNYWSHIFYWPIRVLILTLILFVFWRIYHRRQPFYGLTIRKFTLTPYLWMLVVMLPLITLASTQPDFQRMYPKLDNILPLPNDATPAWYYKLLFELSYGSDFFAIELFFRGFLVIGFVKWVGKDAILPMAVFYCTIHFGKPMGECISSFFGGLLLGIVSYHTRSIYGGLIVHLGIAWLMELGGYLGNMLKW